MDISEPVLLTKLPRAGLDGNGDTKFAQVYGVAADGKRRKRNEICVATDGNSITVHDATNGSSIVSWPVPPDSTFASPVLSERVRISKNAAQRRAWVVLKRGGKQSLQVYSGVREGEESKTSTKSISLGDGEGEVVELNRIHGTTIIVQDNGIATIVEDTNDATVQRVSLKDSIGSCKILASYSM
ncbi:hypothetical protein LTR66_015484, partial [Elasticomyces elasticus]